MRLHELFEDDDGDTGVVQELRDAILDMLTPLAAQGVQKVSIQAIIDKLRDVHSGVAIDRALVLHVLDPQQVKMITKIEGDSVFFNLPDPTEREVSDEKAEQEQDHLKATAVDQAKANMKKQNGVSSSPAPAAPAQAPAKPAAPQKSQQNAGGI
jgi:hypothetical protein